MSNNELIAEARRLEGDYSDNHEVVTHMSVLADALEVSEKKRAAVLRMYGEVVDCSSHRPVQHRDGKPPWCNTCGRTTVPGAALAAIERVRDILNRDDFGDDWEHDEWVYRQAAERKLDDIEEALGSEVRHD